MKGWALRGHPQPWERQAWPQWQCFMVTWMLCFEAAWTEHFRLFSLKFHVVQQDKHRKKSTLP